LVAVLERDAGGNLDPASAESARAAGFARLKDTDSFWLHRAMWPLDNADARVVAADLVERVRRTGLLDT
jgi:hypothetical protein